MNIVTIDFETRWSKADYTLSNMTTEEYIRDPRFKVFGACLHDYGSEEPPRWYNGDDLHDALAQYDWSKTAILAHNAQFDVSILEWKYDCHPSFILDTLSMGRALRGVEVGNSLAKLADEFGLPAKGQAVHSTDGLTELTSYIEAELAAYCAHDVELCEAIFSRFIEGYPAKELKLIDMTLRMYTQPRLVLDGVMLTKAIDEERQQREELLERLDVKEEDLASNQKFASLLESVGVEPPRKLSKTTGNQTLALAKTDALFQAILNGENEPAALLCEARLKVKSTSERTRAQRFLDISKRGALPVPLSYYGAATGRWTASKGSAINMQNLKRGSFLRKAIMAPMGKQLVVGDLSQIEPRVLAWLADYEDMLDIFRAGGDPYAQFGSQMFNIPGMTKDSHPDLRQSAKSALLGCIAEHTRVFIKRKSFGDKVLTEYIESITPDDLVWDGVEWVKHDGVIFKGRKKVIFAHGVAMTPDHKVLIKGEWLEWETALAVEVKDAWEAVENTAPFEDIHREEFLINLLAKTLSEERPGKKTYDILNAGPRNRFTIATAKGPLIVHNCGYGLGWASFASQLLVGFLGAPPVRYERAFAVKLGADQAYVNKFLDWEENGTKLLAIPHTCSKPELLSHAIAAKKIIDIYRATAWPVVSFWNMCGDLLERCLVGGEEYTHKCLTFRKGEIVLPNGMRLHYPNLRKDEDKNWVYGKDATKLYPGKITNNVTQAVARIVMTDGMLRVAKRYPVVGTVHDELIAIAPEDEAQEALDWVLAQMTMEPKYLPGIPLAADGGTNIRYGDAKK